MPVTYSRPAATTTRAVEKPSSTRNIALSTRRSSATSSTTTSASGPADGGGDSIILTSATSTSTTTLGHTSTTSRRHVRPSTTTRYSSSPTANPLSHDVPSRTVPTAAIVAAAAASSIIIIGIIYKLWMMRLRRRGGQYGAAPLPPPRSSPAHVRSVYSGVSPGFQHSTNHSDSSAAHQTRPSESDEEYSNSGPALESPPALMRTERATSWVMFDGRSSPRSPTPSPPSNVHSDPSPPPPPRSPANPFSSEDDVNESHTHQRIISPAQFPVMHRQANGGSQESSPVSPIEDEDDDGKSDVTSGPAALPIKDGAPGPLPSYPSLPTPSTSATYMTSIASSSHDGMNDPLPPPSRHPRSPPPHVPQQQPTYAHSNPTSSLPQSPRQSSYLRNSTSSPFSHDPYSSSQLDRRVSRASSVHTHHSGGARSSRHYSNNYSGGWTPRGAPHLPHVRPSVEIVLPTPLAPQMSGVPMYPVPSTSSSHAHTRGAPMYETGGSSAALGVGGQRSSRSGPPLQRSLSRSSVGSDTWADATLSARHHESSQPQLWTKSDSGRVERSRTQRQSIPRPSALDPPPPSPLLPPTRPWGDGDGDGSNRSPRSKDRAVSARDSVVSAVAPSSWRNSGEPTSAFVPDA